MGSVVPPKCRCFYKGDHCTERPTVLEWAVEPLARRGRKIRDDVLYHVRLFAVQRAVGRISSSAADAYTCWVCAREVLSEERNLGRIRIHYNAPVVLTFSLLALGLHILDRRLEGTITRSLFVTGPPFSFFDPLDYFRFVSHTLGHASLEHLFSNLTMILLLGPILEERYGSEDMLKMILLTGLFVGVVNLLLVRKGLLGASSIVFMCITLISIVDLRRGSVPISFILVALLFIGGEVLEITRPDDVSQVGHIVGAVLGAVFGFARADGADDARPVSRLVNGVFDRFWSLAGLLAAIAIVPALVLSILVWMNA